MSQVAARIHFAWPYFLCVSKEILLKWSLAIEQKARLLIFGYKGNVVTKDGLFVGK